ncbi:MAG: PD40 domain-containing protein [Deltaproteobacteria bacterium]|nr:PD40 domain-containing protein [Deltaproteobacteria bacterium]
MSAHESTVKCSPPPSRRLTASGWGLRRLSVVLALGCAGIAALPARAANRAATPVGAFSNSPPPGMQRFSLSMGHGDLGSLDEPADRSPFSRVNLMDGPRSSTDRVTPPQSGGPFMGQDAYVLPNRPGKNSVRYADFRWRDYDYLDDDGSAGVRLYFYDSEYRVARIVAGFVRQTWRYLSDRFQYKPSLRVPYILYNSYREFLQTNVFQVSEGTLGVTSPQDLRMTLPYFGERQRFLETSVHEMVHQFMIQKVAERCASAGMPSTITAYPLWFIEGIAEYYSHGQGVDSETEMFLRDLVLNQDGEIGYDIPNFAEDRYSYLYTYKYGQARLAFLAETYGEKVIQGVLDQAPRMGGAARRGEPREGFLQLLGRLAGEQPQQIDARWKAWLRKRVYPTYLGSHQDLTDVTELKLPDELDTLAATPDGNLLFYRGVERETGRAKLVLLDRRDPASATQLAIDQTPGTESLRPVLAAVMAVNEHGVAWFSQSNGVDVLHVRSLDRLERKAENSARPYIDLKLGKDRQRDMSQYGILEAGDPTFSPDGKQLAFYGLDKEGMLDIYVLDLAEKDAAPIRRLTQDSYAERDLFWGPEGIVYASDATETGNFNLFLIDPETGVRTRLTNAPVDQTQPVALAGHAAIFTSTQGGKKDLWFLQSGKVKRLTDFSTAISRPVISPHGIYGVAFYGARFRLFELTTAQLLSLDEQDAIPPTELLSNAPPIAFPDEPIPQEAPRYEPLAVTRNWRIDGAQALLGGGGIGYAPFGSGAIAFSDVLGDQNMLTQLSVYGSFDLTDFYSVYINRMSRVNWGFTLFHTFRQGRDDQFPDAGLCGTPPANVTDQRYACEIFYFQRLYGAEGLLSYPLSPFSRIDLTGRIQGVTRSPQTDGIVDDFGYPTTVGTDQLAPLRGTDFNPEFQLSWGWDTSRYGLGGIIGGTSLYVETGVGWMPTATPGDQLYGWVQTDLIQTIKLIGRSKIVGRLAAGYADGSRFGRHFYLSSFDNLRGFQFNDYRLLGDAYYVAQTEMQFPLDVFVRIAFFQNLTGIVGLDFGGVVTAHNATRAYPQLSRAQAIFQQAWDNRSMNWVIGANLGLGPVELRLQFARGIDIGGILANQDANGSPTWVPNISLRYVYF